MTSQLTTFADQAKRLIAASGDQADKERKQLFGRLERLGLLAAGSTLDEVLSLKETDIMSRRLQTVLVNKGLARTMKQARQFIVHKHVMVDGKIVTTPSYLVPVAHEASITFVGTSTLAKEDHPERKAPEPTGTVVNPEKDAETSDDKKEVPAEKKAEAKKDDAKAPAKENKEAKA